MSKKLIVAINCRLLKEQPWTNTHSLLLANSRMHNADQCPLTALLSKPEETNEVRRSVTFVGDGEINPPTRWMLINNTRSACKQVVPVKTCLNKNSSSAMLRSSREVLRV